MTQKNIQSLKVKKRKKNHTPFPQKSFISISLSLNLFSKPEPTWSARLWSPMSFIWKRFGPEVQHWVIPAPHGGSWLADVCGLWLLRPFIVSDCSCRVLTHGNAWLVFRSFSVPAGNFGCFSLSTSGAAAATSPHFRTQFIHAHAEFHSPKELNFLIISWQHTAVVIKRNRTRLSGHFTFEWLITFPLSTEVGFC